MDIRRKRFIAIFVNALIIFSVFFLRYSGTLTLNIGQAVPIILIPIVVSVSMFYSDNAAFVSAALSGLLMDSVASGSSCFNTLFFVVAAAICSLLSNRFLNRNIKAALHLSFLVSLIYFVLKYLIFFVFSSVKVGYDYFTLYLIPSVVYTAVWIIPLYFLQKKLSNYKN